MAAPRYHRAVPAVAPSGSSQHRDRQRRGSSRLRPPAAPPVLVEVHREGIVESRHRGHVVQVSAGGEVERAIGDPSTVVTLRSAVKPFGLVALLESGAADELAISTEELAVMAGSHTGEDKHVRTLQSVFRRASLSQALLACGAEGMPLDARTAARLTRDREPAGAVRHMCSGYHAALILLSRHAGWTLDDYTDPGHKSQLAVRETVARLLGRTPASLPAMLDDCGVATYAVPLVDVARAFLLLADPEGVATDEPRARSIPALTRIRDAMMAAPDLVGGTDEVMDTELMRRRPGHIVSKSGAEGLRGVGLVRAPRARGPVPAGLAVSIEDGDAAGRANRAASVEAMAQMGTLDELDLRAMAAFRRPVRRGPDGSLVATAVARFELAPIGELV
jgi:L-asparaginase II